VPNLLPITMILASLAIAPLGVLTRPVTGPGPILVIVPPWADAGALLARAGTRAVWPVSAPLAVIAEGDAATAARLREAGAWAVTDAAALARICGGADVPGAGT